MSVLYAMAGVILGLLHIPKEKAPSRPRLDTLLGAIAAALSARKVFHRVLGVIPLDTDRLSFLLPLIQLGREVLRHTVHFHELLYTNVAVWEDEAHRMLVSFYEKAEPFTKDDPDLADALGDVHEHIRGSAERGAETAAKNRELRKEAREAGIKEGEERARGQAREDADKALLDAIGKLRGKLGDGGDKKG
jgi:hypothetical protein